MCGKSCGRRRESSAADRVQIRFAQGTRGMNKLFLCTLPWILLFTNSTYTNPSNRTSPASGSSEHVERSLDQQTDGISTMDPAANSAVRPVRELVERWCTAYGDLDEKKLAALESPDIEIVDRFGEVHVAR